ncbi:CRAL/TRIO domain-containing protein [Xylariaceae sp. FL0255]|nr:CRAL/TRIO domain-containing protein [Xylariaceae sp. FL0255]
MRRIVRRVCGCALSAHFHRNFARWHHPPRLLSLPSTTTPFITTRTPLRAHPSSSFALVLLAALLVCAAIVPSKPPSHFPPDSADMATATTTAALPGRPGNLTAEEDEKLRKFWDMFLQAAGVLDDEHDAAGPQAKSSDKPKKKRLNLFKKKKDKTAPTADSNADADDTLTKLSPEDIRATIWTMVKHDNPDALLLRFLRARKWDLHKALAMLVSSASWRLSEMHVDDDVMMKAEEHFLHGETSADQAQREQAQDFLAQMRLGKSFNYGIDKQGRPICICRARLHRQGDQSEQSLERYTVYLIETTRFLLEAPVDTGCVVFDLTGFSLANMDYTPVKFMIRCFEANYPESLGIVLVHKAPWVFQGIWKIIRGWLDPVVASKVHFTNSVQDLEEFIARDKIPEEMEGTSGWNYSYIEPVLNENEKMKDTETRDKLLKEREAIYDEYETKTIEWINESNSTRRTSLNSERAAIAKNLREQYWRLDPYIRSRSLYDRIGMIEPDGSLDYYPQWKPPVSADGAAPAPAATETAADDDVD